MDRRLDDVVKMLEELKCNVPANSHPSSKPARTLGGAPPPTDNQRDRSGPSVELNNTVTASQSDSTMAAYSEFAHDFIQKTVTADPSMSHNPEMHKAFAALKDTIRSFGPSSLSTESSFPHATSIRRSPRGYEMPPIEKVVELIRSPDCKLHHRIPLLKAGLSYTYSIPVFFKVRNLDRLIPFPDQRVMRTIGVFYFFPMDNLADLSLGVYFSQDYSETDFVTVNVGLYYLFQGYSSLVIDAERGMCLEFADMCRKNIDTSLSTLPLYLPPTAGTITALLCGVSFIKTHKLLCI